MRVVFDGADRTWKKVPRLTARNILLRCQADYNYVLLLRGVKLSYFTENLNVIADASSFLPVIIRKTGGHNFLSTNNIVILIVWIP